MAITGATSSIGLEIAGRFAFIKTKIIFNGLGSNEIIKKITIELENLGALEILYHPANLSKPTEIAEMFEVIINKFSIIRYFSE